MLLPAGKSVVLSTRLQAPAAYPRGKSRGRHRNRLTTRRSSRFKRPAARSSWTIGSGMLPQPMPASSNACLEPRSARRHVLTPITEKSRPFVSVERSVSTSCTTSRAAPGPCARPVANGWPGAATGMSSTPPTLIRSMPGRIGQMPIPVMFNGNARACGNGTAVNEYQARHRSPN